MWVVWSHSGWPFLRKLAESGSVHWTECVSMANQYASVEEAEADAFMVGVRWGMTYTLEVVPLEEAREIERKFKFANHLA